MTATTSAASGSGSGSGAGSGSGSGEIRPAHLDRPLRRTSLDPRYTDPHLEELVRVAAERARTQARAEGYGAGWAQGRQAASQQARSDSRAAADLAALEREAAGQEVGELLTALAKVVRSARVTTEPEWVEVADALVEGSLQLASAALGRELRTVDEPLIVAIKGALRQLAEPGDAVVHLNPGDAARLPEGQAAGVRVIADSEVPAGSVVLLTPAQRLRYDLPAALAAAEEVLGS